MQCSSSFLPLPLTLSLAAYPLCLPECLPGLVGYTSVHREAWKVSHGWSSRVHVHPAGNAASWPWFQFTLSIPLTAGCLALSSHASWPHATCHLRRRTSSAAVMPLAALISHSSRHSNLTWPGRAKQGEARGVKACPPAHFLGATISSCRVP